MLDVNPLMGLGQHFLRDGILSADIIHSATQAAIRMGISLSRYLVHQNVLSSSFILNYCAKKFGLPIFDLKHYDPLWLKNAAIQFEIIHRYRVIPLNRTETHLDLGITDPTHYAAITAVSFQTGLRVQTLLVDEMELDSIITHYCSPHILHSQLETTLSKITPLEEQLTSDDVPDQNDEPVIDFVDNLIHDAVAKKITDIHIEPYALHCRIRFRRDGLLYEATTLPLHLSQRIMTRLKIMANLNIAERRLPQDGRILIRKEPKTDIRINTCPTLFGEKIVLRLLNPTAIPLNIDALGLNSAQQRLLLTKLSHPQGLILVTGPTGSGKTITLYSAMHYLNQIEKNISTVEDPIEIELHGINQVNINPKIGLDFPTVLRTFLRQDPDIIMVGEIRDQETANMAVQAGQTGHLVLSTLHTNSALETMIRLKSMGVQDYNLTHSLSLIMAQRLVRKLCQLCKQPDHSHPDLPQAYKALGCVQCYHGYQGRIGIFELLPITEEIAELLSQSDIHSLLNVIKKNDWPRLWDAGLEKVKQGVTSYAECLRVIGEPLS